MTNDYSRLGAITTSKAEANSAYESAKQARSATESALKANSSIVPPSVWSAFSNVDKWFWPNYENFIKASEFSYGNWKEAALNAADQYRAIGSQVADAVARSSGAPIAPNDGKKPDKPEDNTMLIVGGVVAALLVGYLLLPKGGPSQQG